MRRRRGEKEKRREGEKERRKERDRIGKSIAVMPTTLTLRR